MLSSRKVHKEFHPAGAIANAIFRVILAIRFRRGGKSQLDPVQNLLMNVLDKIGEEDLIYCTMTANT